MQNVNTIGPHHHLLLATHLPPESLHHFDRNVQPPPNAPPPLVMKLLQHKEVCELPVRSHHLVLRLSVDAHHARMPVGNSLAIRVFWEKSLHMINICCS